MYWKAVVSYGHVGRKNEVSVARHLEFPKGTQIYEVIKVVNSMPVTKNNSIWSIYEITVEQYRSGL